MISILVPSRGRPENIRRLYKSLEATTRGKWEVLVRLDDDDPKLFDYPDGWECSKLQNIVGPRLLLSELWNELVPYAFGDILMHGGDDITFNTEDWDLMIAEAFPEDGIAVVHGDDMSPNSHKLGTHAFVTRKWVDTVGYLCPPYFSSDYNDLWLTRVADALGRRIYVPQVKTEHHHFAFGKGEMDQTHKERIERHERDMVDKIWDQTEDKRAEDVAKLQAIISG